jgi:hypothetical protein
MKRVFALLVAVPAVLTACTNNGPDFGGEPTGDTGGEASLVLRIEEVGGFVPVEWNFTRQPSIVVMSDGRIYTTPPMIEIYPPPLQTSYEVRKVTSDGVQAIIDRALEVGLDQDGSRDADGNGAQVADATTTVFTFVDSSGTSHEVSAYALGFHSPESEGRAELQELREDFGDLASWLPEDSVEADSELVPATAMRLAVKDYAGDPELPQDEREWPLATSLANFGESMGESPIADRCGTLAGNDLDAFIEAADGANTLTPWISEGKRYTILLDPLTPDEIPTCEEKEYPGGL